MCFGVCTFFIPLHKQGMFLYIQKRPCERRALGYYNVRYAHICKYWMMKKENREKENKTEVLIIRLTKTEKDVLKQAAKNAHLSLSSYSKHAIFSQKIVSKTDVQTVFQLKKIGVNLNQLAKQINSLPSDNNIRYALKRVSEYIENLDKITSSIV